MRPPFVPPPITTKNLLGTLDMIPSFRIEMELEPRVTAVTPRGRRIHQRVVGGPVVGPRLQGQVYPNGGGEFGLIRPDGVEEWFTRFMIIAANGEWIYTHLVGYARPDGYARFQAIFDADSQGPHGWLNESMFIGSATLADSGNHRSMTYFEAA